MLPFDSTAPDEKGPCVNALYDYLHKASQGANAFGTSTKIIPHPLGGLLIAVFLPAPIRGTCIVTGHEVPFLGGVLWEDKNGKVEGWLCSTHAGITELWQNFRNDFHEIYGTPL